MKIFHHNDNDGRCAAAIVYHELSVVFDKPTKDDFVEYNHGWKLGIPEIKEGETVYIVDLSLDDVIMGLIKHLINGGCNVIHIDHHKSTLDRMETLSGSDKLVMDKVTKFYKIGISGSLLTWIYSCMDEEERKNCEAVQFDLTDKRTHVAFDYDTPNMREYRIPTTIRFVDDNDVWLHDIEETKYFCMASMMLEDKHPYSDTWKDLIYGSDYNVYQLVEKGRLLYQYQQTINKGVLQKAFEVDFEGMKTLCLNSCYGNSRVFEDRFDMYPCCIKFDYDGKIRRWRYTMYRSKAYTGDDTKDLSVIAKKYGGGGHETAAGFQLPYFLFSDHADKN